MRITCASSTTSTGAWPRRAAPGWSRPTCSTHCPLPNSCRPSRRTPKREEITLPKRTDAPPALDPAEHRRLGAGLYNYTWTLMEKPDRTAGETDQLIHAVHAS